MSVRARAPVTNNAFANQIRQGIASARQVEAGMTTLTFDELTETEKSAATIGVSPDAWKPISWMNEAHYGELLKSNVISGRLTQQIEAYKAVAMHCI